MFCRAEADIGAFAGAVLPWLAREPFLNNVVCTLVASRVDPGYPVELDALWLSVTEAGKHSTAAADHLRGVAVMTPPRGMLLGDMSVQAAQAVADWLIDNEVRPPTVNGTTVPVDAFLARYLPATKVAAGVTRRSRMFRLDRVDPPAGVAGRARAATSADRDLLVEWSGRFAEEVHGHPVGDPATPIDQRLRRPASDLIWLWETDETAVSMAWLNEQVACVSRVSGVYTPPEHRGHGYASAGVAHTSRHALDTGSRACMLFTDLANPTSNKIYQQIGYRPIGGTVEWTLDS